MENMKCHSDHNDKNSRTLRNIVMAIFMLGGGYYLWMQHRAHVLQFLPFAIFLLCPLMHFFPGGCHGGHKNSGDSKNGGHNHA